MRLSGIVARLTSVLLFLVLLTTCLLSGMMAKYATGGIASEHTRVASFGQLTLTETANADYRFIPGIEILKDPKVSTTASEVTTIVTVEMKAGSSWSYDTVSGTFRILLDNQVFASWKPDTWWTYAGMKAGSTDTYLLQCVLAPGTVLKEVSIIERDKIDVSGEISYQKYYENIAQIQANGNLEFTVEARQLD